jgi:alkylated DNA nucleotide flippase Atl1
MDSRKEVETARKIHYDKLLEHINTTQTQQCYRLVESSRENCKQEEDKGNQQRRQKKNGKRCMDNSDTS